MNSTDTVLLSGKILEVLGRIKAGENARIADRASFLQAVRVYETDAPAAINLTEFMALLHSLQSRHLIGPGDLADGYGLTPEGESAARALIYARDKDDEDGNVCLLRME